MPINAKQTSNNIEKNVLFAGEMFKRVKKNVPILQKEIQMTDPEDGLSCIRIVQILDEMEDQIDTWRDALNEAAADIYHLVALYNNKVEGEKK